MKCNIKLRLLEYHDGAKFWDKCKLSESYIFAVISPFYVRILPKKVYLVEWF
jgi:hypothetical protein